jgi:hypothetical protein
LTPVTIRSRKLSYQMQCKCPIASYEEATSNTRAVQAKAWITVVVGVGL